MPEPPTMMTAGVAAGVRWFRLLCVRPLLDRRWTIERGDWEAVETKVDAELCDVVNEVVEAHLAEGERARGILPLIGAATGWVLNGPVVAHLDQGRGSPQPMFLVVAHLWRERRPDLPAANRRTLRRDHLW